MADSLESAILFLGSPVMNGKPFSNTKDTTVTKEKMRAIKAFYLFVPFVMRLFPVKNDRAQIY